MTIRITRATLATLPPHEAAALWMIQRDTGAPVEAGLFETWLEADDANRAAWQALSEGWSAFDDADDPDLADLRVAALSAEADPPAMMRRWLPKTGVAAAAAVIAMIGWQLVPADRQAPPGASRKQTAEGTTYAAGAGETRRFVLADGTAMTLAGGTRARVAFTVAHRVVTLGTGRAKFDVAADATRQFSVDAGGRRIVDTGTRFDVEAKSGTLRVSLHEGGLRIVGGAVPVTLTPGQQLVARSGQRDVVEPVSTAGGALLVESVEFDNVPLGTAIERINRDQKVLLFAPDRAVAAMRITGRFRTGDPEGFARTVAALLPLRVIRVGPSRIELRRR